MYFPGGNGAALFGFLVAGVLLCGSARGKEITLKERMDQIGPAVRERVKPWFARQRVEYPPERLVFAVIKDEMRLKVYASSEGSGDDDWTFVSQYKLAKLSGKAGPKLRSGDKQVPEGVYSITYVHPASKYWLSLALNYPNAFDRARAREDGRTKLGGDIMIHGWWFSTGCVAVGNTAVEDLFVMANDVGPDNLKVVIAPTDFRGAGADSFVPPKTPGWVGDLYENLDEELAKLGSDGLTTDSRLISYADLAPPPEKKKGFLMELMEALVEAAETSGTTKGKAAGAPGKAD
jgi:hypothetical protein